MLASYNYSMRTSRSEARFVYVAYILSKQN